MDVLPESRPCEYCFDSKSSNMSLRFINPNQAVYICEICDEIYPDDGSVIQTNVNDQPLKESDLEQIGLPVELLSHFPEMKLDLANKIIRVVNNRWCGKLKTLWQEFLTINEKINREGGGSRKMEYKKIDGVHSSETNNNYLFDVSSINETELEEITRALDTIENKAKEDLLNSKVNGASEKICSIDTVDFFKQYKEDALEAVLPNKRKVYTNKRRDMRQERSNLKQLEQKMMMKNMQLKTAVLHSKYPKFSDYILHGAQNACSRTSAANVLPVRITKETLSKMLETSKF